MRINVAAAKGRVLLVSWAAAAALACSGRTATVSLEQRGDTQIVTTPVGTGVPIHRVETIETVWRSDRLESPRAVVAIGDRLVVADRFSLHFLTRGGQYLESRGRRGGGPGEFDGIEAVGQRGDTLFVYDDGLYRLSLYDATGMLLEEHRVRPHSRYPAVRASNRLLGLTRSGYMLVAWPRLIPSGRPTYAGIVWQGIVGDSTRLLGEWPDFELRRDGGRSYERNPLGPRAQLAVGNRGRWAFGTGQDYCVSIAKVDAASVVRACREWNRALVTAAILDPEWAALRQRTVITPKRMESLKAAFSRQELGNEFPSYDHLWFAESGDLWVRTIGPDRATLHPYLLEQYPELRPSLYSWDVFDEVGQLKMTVEMPSRFEPLLIFDHEAYGFADMVAGDRALAVARW